MNSEDIKAIKELLAATQQIVIIPHKNPDGDAIGSTLGLWHYLNNNGNFCNSYCSERLSKISKMDAR